MDQAVIELLSDAARKGIGSPEISAIERYQAVAIVALAEDVRRARARTSRISGWIAEMESALEDLIAVVDGHRALHDQRDELAIASADAKRRLTDITGHFAERGE